MENPIKMDDLVGFPIFLETPICPFQAKIMQEILRNMCPFPKWFRIFSVLPKIRQGGPPTSYKRSYNSKNYLEVGL